MFTFAKNSVTITTSKKKPIILFGVWENEVTYFTTPAELKEWERRATALLGEKVDAKAIIAGGGCCCGTSGGMCDSDSAN